MGEITFGGLASGLDSDSIISALMEIESEPLTRLENDKTYFPGDKTGSKTECGKHHNCQSC